MIRNFRQRKKDLNIQRDFFPIRRQFHFDKGSLIGKMVKKTKENNKKVGIYVRVSTEEQAKEGISLDAQIERCRAFCHARGWSIHKIYTDAGYSAGTLNRPALKDLFEDINKKEIGILLVYKIDRFSRRLKDLILALDQLKSLGIDFTSVTEQIDTTTAMGEAFFQMIGVFAQLERGMIKERVELAFEKKIKGGEVLYRPPFGYFYQNKKLVTNPEEAEKVRQIFEMKAAGIDYKEICQRFNLPVSTFYQIISNPIYLGKIKYRGKLYQSIHSPIINEELFLKVNPRFYSELNTGDQQ